MYCTHQYLLIDPKNVATLTKKKHIPRKIVRINAYISEALKARKLQSVIYR